MIQDPSVGLLYDSSRADELAARLVQFMDNAELRTRTGAAARTSILARGMTRQAMAGNYRALYQQELSTH